MVHRIVTQAGKGTDAAWFFEAVLRYARARNVLPHRQHVVSVYTIDDAMRAIESEKPTVILSAMQQKKTFEHEQLPPPVVNYLGWLRTYRERTEPHVPLVLVGNYPTGPYETNSGNGTTYCSFEHAARLAMPDVCVVERRYAGAGFNAVLERIVSIFSDGGAFKDRPVLVTTITKLVPDHKKPEVSRIRYGFGTVLTAPQVILTELPDYFRQVPATQTPQ